VWGAGYASLYLGLMGRKKSSKSAARPIASTLAPNGKPTRSVNDALQHGAVAIALFLLLLLTWSNSFDDGFALDNKFFILLDPRVHQVTWANIALILNRGYWNTYNAGLYRPLTTLSYLFNYAILGNGDDPAGYHWINIFLHFLNAFLVYVLTLRLLRKLWPAIFIAALWAVHPVLTESVTNIVGRADLLAGLAQLSGFWMYLKSRESAGWQRVRWLAGLMAVTTLGVFSKESAVAILGVIVLYEIIWWKERKQLQGLLLGCAAIVPPLLFMWYQRTVVLATSGPMEVPFIDNPLKYAPFVRSRLTSIVVVAKYLWLLVWPLRLSCDYSFNQIPIANGNLHDWLAWISVLVVAGAVILTFKWSRVAFFFAVFALASFVPVSNFLFFTGTIMAERFLYLPAIGFAACFVMVTYWIGRRIGSSAVAPIVLCMIIAALAIRTWERNLDWHDDVALWTSAVSVAPNSAKAHQSLATALSDADPSHSNIDQIIEEEEKSLAILDSLPDAQNAAFVYADAGRQYSVKGDLLLQSDKSNGQLTITPGSLAAYQRSLEILTRGLAIDTLSEEKRRTEKLSRGIPESEMGPAGLPSLYSSLAVTYVRLGKDEEAYTAAARAALLSPDLADPYITMGEALLAEGKRKEAVISLIEGFLITDDSKILPLIREVYKSDSGEGDCAFRNSVEAQSLNSSCETVRNDICKASGNLIKLLQQDQNRIAADRIRDRAAGVFECSPSSLR
jgi:protein O-mannosyl-transferase